MKSQLDTLAGLIEAALAHDGEVPSAIHGLYFGRSSAPSRPVHAPQWPCLTLVVQGAKSLVVGQETFHYGPGEFVLVAVDVPTASRVVRATGAKPYLGLAVAIDPVRLNELLARSPMPASDDVPHDVKAVSVARIPEKLLEALVRLVRLLEEPQGIPAMAPLIEQEILYRLLTSPEGWRLVQIATKNSPANRVAQAIRWLKANFRKTLRIEDVARKVGMSESSLHQHFKSVTGLTPIQYQKHLRLIEARRLMLIDRLDVTSAALEVGYQSPSQFSRDFKRQYGLPPREHLTQASHPD